MNDDGAEVVGLAAYVRERPHLRGEHVARIVEHERTELRKWIIQWFAHGRTRPTDARD